MATIKKYNGSTWVDTTLRQYKTATADIEPTIYTDGTAITSYTIKGNTVQNGTPTPSNPVIPNGVGVRTAQLWNISNWLQNVNAVNCTFEALPTGVKISTTASVDAYLGEAYRSPNVIQEYRKGQLIPVKPDTTYTLSVSTSLPKCYISYVDSEYNVLNSAYTRMPAASSYTFTTPQNCVYIIFRMGKETTGAETFSFENIMLSESSTAKPYEPYGYKIPISSGQQTIDIYIGDLPLLKSLDGTAVDEISNSTLTRRVDADGSVLPTPTTTQITMPSIPTTDGANSITVDTTVQPSEFTATWTGWHDATVKEWDGSIWG